MGVGRVIDTDTSALRLMRKWGGRKDKGKREKREVILECLPILKNVSASHTLMYCMLSRLVGQQICCKVLLPVLAAALLRF